VNEARQIKHSFRRAKFEMNAPILDRLERLALDRNCLAKEAAAEIRKLQALSQKAKEMAVLFLEIYDRPDDVLDGFGPGEVDLVLMARELRKAT
jgi:hypothetical protein